MSKKVNFSFFYLITLFLMFLLVSIYSNGQGYQEVKQELDQIVKQTRWRIGPFRLFPTVNFRNIGYDNNVYNQRDVDNPISDYTITFSPQVKVYLLYRNFLILTLTEEAEYVYYFNQKGERGWNNSISPEFKFLFLNRFVLSGRYSYENRRWRPSSEFDERANELRESYRGSLFYETARRTSLRISASLEKISYEDITTPGEEIYLSRELNREERSGNLEFYYKVFSESLFFLGGGYTEYKFAHIQSRWRDSYSYQAYSGTRFPLLGRIRGTVSLGYKKLLPRTGEKEGFSGLIGNTSLDFRVRRFRLRVQYNRDCYFSYWTDSTYFIEDRYGAGISFYLTKFLRLDYNFSYGEATYPELMLLQMPDGRYEEIKRKDIYRVHRAGFVFRIIRNAGIGLMFNFWERESNYYWASRNRGFISGYVTYEF
jgi:hypothetical protein